LNGFIKSPGNAGGGVGQLGVLGVQFGSIGSFGDIKTKLIEESNFVLVSSGLLYIFFSMIFKDIVKYNKSSNNQT
jgi:hypothetical protein